MEIADAIRQVWSPDGVLILADLGSALLNAQMAIEMLDKEMQSCCRISNAPLVEGSIVATVEASLGRSLGEVEKAAATACTLMKNN